MRIYRGLISTGVYSFKTQEPKFAACYRSFVSDQLVGLARTAVYTVLSVCEPRFLSLSLLGMGSFVVLFDFGRYIKPWSREYRDVGAMVQRLIFGFSTGQSRKNGEASTGLVRVCLSISQATV